MNSSQNLAKRMLEVLPPLVNLLRSELRPAVKGQLNPNQFRVLVYVHRGVNTVTKIAETVGVTKPSMSKLIDGMVERGMIKRVGVDGDRRQYAIVLTPKGQKLFTSYWEIITKKLSDFLSETLNSSEREALGTGLGLIAGALFKRKEAPAEKVSA